MSRYEAPPTPETRLDPHATFRRVEWSGHRRAETPAERDVRRVAQNWQGEDAKLEQAIRLREEHPDKFALLGPSMLIQVGIYEGEKAAHAEYEGRDKTPRPPSLPEARDELDRAVEVHQEARARALEPGAAPDADRELARAESRLDDAKRAFVEAA